MMRKYMPLKFVTRQLRGNSYYHVFNQGLGKREIFLDKTDYEKFLYYLDIYTMPLAQVMSRYPKVPERLKMRNLNEEIKILAFCLMPDHWHLLLKQKTAQALPRLIKQLTNAYTTYFNAKYKRVGGVMAGRYKAALIESEFLVAEMARFIHLNPLTAGLTTDARHYPWSSINDHGATNELINRLGGVEGWEKFHLDREAYQRAREKIRSLMIDN